MQRHIGQGRDDVAGMHLQSGVLQKTRMPIASPAALLPSVIGPRATRKERRVFDAGGGELLPGSILLDEAGPRTSTDQAAVDVFVSCGMTYDFYANNFFRNSIDDKGMRLDATVHFGTGYVNACWNGRQLVFGDGDGRLFLRLISPEVVAHELTHGTLQYSARLPYAGQAGAVAEHLCDACGITAKDWWLGREASQSDWLIGTGVFSPIVKGTAIRSMMNPGTAYDDPILGRDPQPAHMRDYVHGPQDNGGVHVNSGILNRAYAMAAASLGGCYWNSVGRIWYRVLTGTLLPQTTFRSFANDTVRVAGELFGRGEVQQTVADAWAEVGVPVRPLAAFNAPRMVIAASRSFVSVNRNAQPINETKGTTE
jgi:Zn-dependent metalloprotease